MQLAIEANQDDVFLYRNQTTNNWFRVASREWSNSAFAPITHSHAISDVTGLQTALDGKQAALSGTGFVKISGTTITYDNSTYLTTSSAASTYQSILVSGTNIKTINSTSLLGSGNVSVGTVTSVGLSVPTGLNISGSPVTSSGTLAVSFASGYSIPTTAKQTQWDAAYTYSGVGHIPLAGTNSLAGNIIPVTGNTYDLGSSTNRFSNIYARFFYQEGNLVATQSWVTSQNYLTTVGTSNIQNSAVTLPKIQNIASKTVLANITSSAAAPDEVLISTIKEEMGDAEGTYVPSFTNVSNASSFSPDGDAMWTKSGDIVTVYGVVEQEATAAGIVQFTISLPIASDLDGSSQLVGQFISDVTASGKSYTAPIKAEITSNKALVSFDSEREVSVLHYHFRYIVQ